MSNFEIRDDQATVHQVLDGAELDLGFSPDQMGIAYDDGVSLDMLARETGQGVELIGWHIPVPNSSPPPETIENSTTLAQLPPDRRNVNTTGKGVGARLHNTWEAALGSTDGAASLYAAAINPDALHDARRSSDRHIWGQAIRVAEHAGKALFTAGSPARLAWLVEQIHIDYGGADAVIRSQPPAGIIHQRRQGARDEILPSTFAIIRTPGLLRRAGVRIGP